jgi:quercetin dioxygenase-like cupin family protein
MKYQDLAAFDQANVFGTGAPNVAYAPHFDGKSFLHPLVRPGEAALFLANVTFEPGCRNHWHIHHAASGGGQMLLCTAGEGWYQEENGPLVGLKEGSVVVIPAGKKHWHGAKADSWFSHIAFELPGTETRTEWLGPVTGVSAEQP